jgi:hypothetical protein
MTKFTLGEDQERMGSFFEEGVIQALQEELASIRQVLQEMSASVNRIVDSSRANSLSLAKFERSIELSEATLSRIDGHMLGINHHLGDLERRQHSELLVGCYTHPLPPYVSDIDPKGRPYSPYRQ